MHWKGRQMFGGGPSGIVQMMGGGMTPYPTHTMPDGSVMRGAVHGAGYEAGGMIDAGRAGGVLGGTVPAGPLQEYIDAGRAGGVLGGTVPAGPSMEERIAKLAAQQGKSVPEMKVQILQKTAADQGLQLPPEAVQQYAVGMISLQDALSQGTPVRQAGSMGAMAMQQPNAQIQMQDGGVIPELFEEGDSDINNALNTMASVSNPEVPDMPASNGMALPGGEMGGEKATVDQGLESLDPSLQKMPFQKMAINVVKQADELLAQEDYANIEEIEQQVQEQLNNIDAQYRLQTGAKDTILTEEFLNVLDSLTRNSQSNFDEAPAYSHGGVHPTLEEQEMELYIRNLGGGTSADPEKMQEIIEKYRSKSSGSSEMLKKQIAKARSGTLLGGKTKQSGLSGLLDVMGQADVAEAAALGAMPKQLSANEAALERMAMENELAMYGGSKGTGMTARGKDFLLLQRVLAMPDSAYKNQLLDSFNVDTEAKTIKEFVGDIAARIGKLESRDLKNWKKNNGFGGVEYDDFTIPQLAVEQARRLAAAMRSSLAPTGPAETKTPGGNRTT